MQLWLRLQFIEVGWVGLFALVAAFVVASLLRRALPEARRERGRVTVLLLGAAPILHLVATGLRLLGDPGASAAVHLVNLVIGIFGVTGLAWMVVFDLALGRTRVPTVVRDFTQALAIGSVLVVLLKSGGVDAISALTTSAVAGAIVGFALQGILSNAFAGMILQIDRTLRLGDIVQWGQRTGTIEQIGWRSTQILTREGDTAVVPNSMLLTTEVLNLSRPTRRRRVTVTVPFHRRHAPTEVRRALLGACEGIAGLAKEPAPVVGVADFDVLDPRHVLYVVKFWVEDVLDEPRLAGEVRERAWEAAALARLEGPWVASGEEA